MCTTGQGLGSTPRHFDWRLIPLVNYIVNQSVSQSVGLKSNHQDPQRVVLVSNRNSWIVGVVVVAFVVAVLVVVVAAAGAVALVSVIEMGEEGPSFQKSRCERPPPGEEDWHQNPTRSLRRQVPREDRQRYPTLDRQRQRPQPPPKTTILLRMICGSWTRIDAEPGRVGPGAWGYWSRLDLQNRHRRHRRLLPY